MNEELREALTTSSLHALLLLTSKALIRSGFGDIHILDRRETRQKSRFGGHEMLCETSLGSFGAKVIVKVINDAVRVRMLDELAGAVDRMKADMGLLISPRHLTKNAKRLRQSYSRSRIEVFDGDALAKLLEDHRVGVRAGGGVDYAFMASLEEASARVLRFLELEGV